MNKTCQYNKISEDGYGAHWKTQCGIQLYYESPIEVGFSRAPKPTDNGSIYCSYCGGKIKETNEKL